MPIIKNIGTKILSKKIKKQSKSAAVKDKTKNKSKNKINKQNSFKFLKFLLHVVNKHIGKISVVNNKKKIDIPSTPHEVDPNITEF